MIQNAFLFKKLMRILQVHMLYPHSNYDLIKINKSQFSKKKVYVLMNHQLAYTNSL